ncbi:MAG: fructosamine kinase family protein [Gammaproteobacteria bacterium]|nr:fructosamine kinase family protein [Gammaproteobacteria bacterium]
MISVWSEIEHAINQKRDRPFVIQQRQGVSGGCINSAFRLSDGAATYFVKLNQPERLEMFVAEAEGLLELENAPGLRSPRPIASGAGTTHSWLVLENIPFGGTGDMAKFGSQLAAMHRITADRFGWQRSNTIGSTPQLNDYHHNWIDFWRECRLLPQLQWAAQGGCSRKMSRLGERLLQQLPQLLAHHCPQPSLLHGDLWSGNYAFSEQGEAVIFDPAVYYGDRETDIAMTELFGGFSRRFYDAYEEAWPLDSGYQQRKKLYNLYHLLNHFNMFGGGYGSQAEGVMEQLIAA